MAPPVAAPAPAKPAEYWNDPALRLTNGSIDEKGAKASKKPANVPDNYVSEFQKDLIVLGYLKAGSDDGAYGSGMERAVKHFQRHARRASRMKNGVVTTVAPWAGAVTGVCDQGTAKEVRAWIANGYSLPLGVYKIVKIDGGRLRDDVAKLWQQALDDVKKLGCTLLPPGAAAEDYYSDTWRNPANGFKSTGGNSKLSMHYTGRAVDLSMAPAGGKGQRWWIVREVKDDTTYWRLYCKTDKQDGSQGKQIAAKSQKYYEFYHSEGEKNWIPGGYYLDLTDFLSTHHFERIPAQKGWEGTAKKQEWWHFYYAEDVQDTFLDEMELIGYKESQLVGWGWTQADLDHSPG